MALSINIREAEMTDVLILTKLMNELGYETTPDEMKIRFTNILNHKDYKTFVAVAGSKVVGMVGNSLNHFYEKNGNYVRILALVISNDFRQKGIGKQLMEASENWAREIGADWVLLNCGNREERKIAHHFYQKLGYHIKSFRIH